MKKRVDVSVIIPARNERFLEKTVKDILTKTESNAEILVVLDGYQPSWISEQPGVHYIHLGQPRGMRAALNAGVDIASGKYVMKLDGHCMVAKGFDRVLAEHCEDNWVCVPTRHRLDPINWRIDNASRPPINYQLIDLSNDELNGMQWKDKNKNKDLEVERVADIISCQGSSYFLPKDLWHKLELLDDENYGSLRRDSQEVMFKNWTTGGRCVRIKDTWYAHLHKGKTYGRGYKTDKNRDHRGIEYAKKWNTGEAWDKQEIPLRDVFEEFFPDLPGYEEWRERNVSGQ